MATRKPSPQSRSIRPAAEYLEGRQLLSGVVTGMDSKGDTWTLKLIGPGALNVTKQNDSSGNPAPLNSATDINTITVAGTDPLASRLVGTVKPAAGSDGKVYFQTFTQLGDNSERVSSGLGMLSISMPNFWLASTTPASSSTTTPTTPSMSIPDGVSTLKFGGVDTTHNQPPAATAANNMYTVALGLPSVGGSHIIIDKSISSTQQTTTSGSTTPTTIQHGVVFAVSGRLDLFQANAINGDAAHPPGQFSDLVSTATGTGGTYVISGTAGVGPFLNPLSAALIGAVTGQIGDLRVGGNATNLTAIVEDGTGGGNAKLTNFSVGGETQNVMVVAPNGLKNAVFGAGMDTTEILAHVINTLSANRGAVNSNVYVDHTISQLRIGGDVTDSNFHTGVFQNFTTIYDNITGFSNTSIVTSPPTAPPLPNNAEIAGGMTALVAGNVTNSVFSASVEPFNSIYGDPNQIVLPGGHIAAKVEGTISNSIATPSTPNTAFFGAQVHLNHGPVIPPNVPQPPYAGPERPVHAPGLHNNLHIPQLKGLKTLPPSRVLFSSGVYPAGPIHKPK